VKQRLPQQMAQYQQPGFEPRNAHEAAMKRMFENMQSVKQRVAEKAPQMDEARVSAPGPYGFSYKLRSRTGRTLVSRFAARTVSGLKSTAA
jgi:hypothetical protein